MSHIYIYTYTQSFLYFKSSRTSSNILLDTFIVIFIMICQLPLFISVFVLSFVISFCLFLCYLSLPLPPLSVLSYLMYTSHTPVCYYNISTMDLTTHLIMTCPTCLFYPIIIYAIRHTFFPGNHSLFSCM